MNGRGETNGSSGKGHASFLYTGEHYSGIPRDVTRVRVDPPAKAIVRCAFQDCKVLAEVQLSKGLEIIGDYAFSGCISLKRIEIPTTVKVIGEGAFGYCEQLEEVNIMFEKPKRTGVRSAFQKICKSPKLLKIPFTAKLIGLERIGVNSFRCCKSLRQIKIPPTVNVIGENSFDGCGKLSKVEFCEGLERIGGGAFFGSSVKFIKIPSSVKVIGNMAFRDCELLDELELCEGLQEIGDSAFYGCNRVRHIKIPSTVKIMGRAAFNGCGHLAEVELSSSLEKIRDWVFYGCSSLACVKIPAAVKVIGENSFNGCDQMVSVELCDGLESIQDSAFDGCKSLKLITVPSSVKAIGEAAFCDCQQMEKAVLCEGLEEIGSCAFRNCISLKLVRIPSTVKEIGVGTFSYCRQLFSVEICHNTEKVDKSVFNYCPSLRNISIPLGSHAPDFSEGCYDLMNFFGTEKNMLDAMKSRLDGLPMHYLCYYQSYDPKVEAMRADKSLHLSDVSVNDKDCFGMVPLHVLACSMKQDIGLYRLIISRHPKSLVTVDKWGCPPIFYAIWGDAPQDIIQLLAESQKSHYPDLALDWDRMVATLCRAGASLETVQRLLETHQVYFSDNVIYWQKAARELAIRCLVQRTFLYHADCKVIMESWRSTMEAFSRCRVQQELSQSLLDEEQTFIAHSLDKEMQYLYEEFLRPLRGWWHPLYPQQSILTFQFLVKCDVINRLKKVGVRAWREKIESLAQTSPSEVPSEMETHFAKVRSALISCEHEHNMLKDAMVLLELSIWKYKMTGLGLEKPSKSNAETIHFHVSSGAGIVILNIMPYLIKPV